MNCPSAKKRAGIALIIVLAVLFVLAMLAAALVAIQGREVGVSQNYLDSVRAKLVAQSGVAEAVNNLKDAFNDSEAFFTADSSYPSWVYWGNVTDKTKNPPNMSTPLEDATTPSLAYKDAPVQNPLDNSSPSKAIFVNGKSVGFSGLIETGINGRNSEIYKLKIVDCNSQIYLNDGVEEGAQGPTTQNLKRVLTALGDQFGITSLGTTLIDNRPKKGWMNKYEILSINGVTSDIFDKIKNLVTVNAWIDKNVVNPVPLSADVLNFYPVGSSYYRGNPAIYRYGSSGAFRGYNNKWKEFKQPLVFAPDGAQPTGIDHAIYGNDELNPVYVEISARAPININLAPKEVLISLLTGLKGFFVVERRKDSPLGSDPANGTVDGYSWLDTTHTFDPGDKGTSATGFIYSTIPIEGPAAGGTKAVGECLLAETIANEIVYCRSKGMSPVSKIDYNSVEWGGQFKNWRQFNKFCDALVGTLLVDNRNIYIDYLNGTTYSSDVQKKIAAQAVADLLKANFNPNLHLNELNPDKNMFNLVDKTDLICNSTEFCFTPMGYFEIESLGMVLAPDGSEDSFTAGDNDIKSRCQVGVVVKLFDAFRETSQADFAKGTLSAKKRSIDTNNNLAIETGPEVTTGAIQKEVKSCGYLALPTIGGDGVDISPDVFTTTPAGTSESDAVIVSHFSRDFKASYHASAEALKNDDLRNDVANIQVTASSWNYPVPPPEANLYIHGNGWDTGTPGQYIKRELTKNYPRKSESASPPYGPSDSPGENGRYRVVRDFVATETAKPKLDLISPSDQRVDGAFIERHSAVAYWMDEGMSWDSMHGVVAFWVKPSFYPEMAGKPRIFFSAARFHSTEPNYINPTPFGLFFFPAHDAKAGEKSKNESAFPVYNLNAINQGVGNGPNGVGRFRPASLGFGVAFKASSGYNTDYSDGYYANLNIGINSGVLSPTLNHNYHTGCTYTVTSTYQVQEWVKVPHYSHYHMQLQWVTKTKSTQKSLGPTVLKDHSWMHVVGKWTLINDSQTGFTPYYCTQHSFQNDFSTAAGGQGWHWDLYIDGKEFPTTTKGVEPDMSAPNRRPTFSVNCYQINNDGSITPHQPKGKYVTETTMVQKYNLKRVLKQVPVDVPDYAYRTEMRSRRVITGYEPYIYSYYEAIYIGETTQTRWVYRKTGTKEVTTTEQVKVGEVEKTRKVWKIVGYHKELYRDPPHSYNLKERQVPDWGWVDEKYKEPIYETRTKTITVDVYEWKQETYTTASYRYELRTETRQRPVYGYETYPVTVSYITGYHKEIRPQWVYENVPYWAPVTTKRWVQDDSKITVVANTIRLGETSTHGLESLPFARNWSADATIDEFYLWNKEESTVQRQLGYPGYCHSSHHHAVPYGGQTQSSVYLSGYTVANGPSVTKALDLYKLGRYYRTDDEEATFTSATIDLTKLFPKLETRGLPPASTAAAPKGTEVEIPKGAVGTGAKSKFQLIGVAWTWAGEAVEATTLKPVLYDYADPSALATLYPEVKVAITADGNTYGSYKDDGFSEIRSADGKYVTIEKPEDVKYSVTINSKGGLNTVLLATPYFDDITIYVSSGPEIVSYLLP